MGARGGTVYRPRSSPGQNATTTTNVTSEEVSATGQVWDTNEPVSGESPLMLIRFVRLDTGSSSDPVFANHTQVTANGNGSRPARLAMEIATGAISTAVVSRLNTAVTTRHASADPTHSNQARPRAATSSPRPRTSKNPDRSHTSETTAMARRNTSTGSTCARKWSTHSQ
jgi:hypothetical protein